MLVTRKKCPKFNTKKAASQLQPGKLELPSSSQIQHGRLELPFPSQLQPSKLELPYPSKLYSDQHQNFTN